MDNFFQWAFILSRSIFDSEIFIKKPSDWLKVWIYILWKVNFKPNWLPIGSKFFRFSEIADACGVTYNTVDKSINYFRKNEMLATQKATHWIVVSVLNYATYQNLNNYKSDSSGETEARQKRDKSDNINKNGNNDKNDNNINSTKVEWENKSLVVLKWNEDINSIISEIKKTVQDQWFIYKAGKYERNRAQNILTGKDFAEVCEKANMSKIEFCTNIIKLSAKLDFWNGKVYNCTTLYEHYPKIYNEALRIKTEKRWVKTFTI